MYAYKPIDTVFVHNIIYIIILLFDTKNKNCGMYRFPSMDKRESQLSGHSALANSTFTRQHQNHMTNTS